MTSGRVSFGGSFALDIEGADAGVIASASGGEAFGVVVSDPPAGGFIGKHLAGVGYSPIVVEMAVGAGGPLTQWVMATLGGFQTPKNGALVTFDTAQREHIRLLFRSAVITRVEFPAAAAASKDAARMRVTIQPASTQLTPGSGVKPAPSGPTGRRKMAVASNFRFSIAGLEAAGRRVVDVSAVQVRRVELADDSLPPGRSTSALDVSNLTFSVPEADAGPYMEWFKGFVGTSGAGAGQERTATLSLLDATLTTELTRIDLAGVGIVRVSRELTAAQPLTRIEMYCERVSLV